LNSFGHKTAAHHISIINTNFTTGKLNGRIQKYIM